MKLAPGFEEREERCQVLFLELAAGSPRPTQQSPWADRRGGNTGLNATTSDYVYDADGNLLEDDDHVYAYDVLNRQTAVYTKDMNQPDHRGAIVAQFFYGPGGERIGKEDYDASGAPSTYTQYL